jgi:hypothetical protein
VTSKPFTVKPSAELNHCVLRSSGVLGNSLMAGS